MKNCNHENVDFQEHRDYSAEDDCSYDEGYVCQDCGVWFEDDPTPDPRPIRNSRTFKISFKRQPHFGYQTCLVNADSASEARGELIRHHGGLYSIRSVSIQCAGETKSGNPCQRFSANDYCCDGHNPEAAKKAQRIKTLTDIRDLADDLIRLAEENHPDFQEAFSYYEAEIDEAGDNLTNVVGEAEHPYEA